MLKTEISKEKLDLLAQDMLTAALKVAEAKIGKIDGDLAGTVFSDDWVQRKFRNFILFQLSDNVIEKKRLL